MKRAVLLQLFRNSFHFGARAGAVALLASVAACGGWTSRATTTGDEELLAGRCGVERWSVKTGTDSQAGQVGLAPVGTTIAALAGLSAPSSLPASSRIGPAELQAVRLTNVTLTQYKLENDSDIHLVLTSGGSTMIAEIPDSGCVGNGSPFAAAISAAQASFAAKYTATNSFQSANVPVTITGVPFFDAPHGQTGVAPNAIELHPVLSICFGQDCAGAGTPDFALAASPSQVTSTGGAAATSAIGASATGGFSGAIALSTSGVPAGARASFDSTSLPAGGQATLTLSPGSAAAGTYAIAIAGASGALRHATSVSWTIAGSGGGGGDTTPPSVVLGAPSAGATVSGTVTVSASATDDTSVARTEVYLDGALLGSVQSGQFSAPWDTTRVTNGAHTLSARAWDPANNVGLAADVTVTVSNSTSTPPPDQELVVNGGFEGTLSPWHLGGAKLPIDSSLHAHSGSYALRCGSNSVNEPTGDSYAYQSIAIPAGAASAVLTFWAYAKSSDLLPYDYQEAAVLDSSGHLLQPIFHMDDDSRAWRLYSADVTKFAGRSVLVFFNVHSDGVYDPTALWVDDVSLKISGGGAGGGDTTPPSVSLLSPAPGASVSGTVTLRASATDDVGVTRVDFFVDGAPAGSASSAPYTASWDTTAATDGAHSVVARASDAAGNLGTSASATVNVSNGTTSRPPSVRITAPAAGSTVSAHATLLATASGSASIARVDFAVDGAVVASSSAAPFSADWDTTRAANGAHTLTATATDSAGLTGTSPSVAVTVSNQAAGGLKTVFVIVMENHNWSSFKGSSSAPYVNNTLLPLGAHAESYFNPAGNHPSLPNYLWLEAGTNFGIANDSPPSTNHQSTTQHLVSQLSAAGLTWKAYQEGIGGSSCPLTTSGLFAPKHLAMLYFDDVTNTNSPSSQTCISHVRPYAELSRDLSSGTVANYNFITPDLCHDGHNSSGCASGDSVANSDAWLAAEVPKILASAAYQNGGALFITWDESEGGDFPVGMIVLSPQAKRGYSNNLAYTHGSALRTFQEIFKVGPFLGDAANQKDLSDLFQAFP